MGRLPLNPKRLVLSVALAVAGLSSSFGQMENIEGELPEEWNSEPGSPEQLTPATVEQGLRSRAIPILQRPPAPETDYVPLYRLTRSYYNTLFAIAPPQFLPNPDPSSFRPVTTYDSPIGLQPRKFEGGVFEIHPWFGLAQSFESNVNLTSTNPIADFYLTPRAGVEFQLGSGDSIYSEGYDTILALHGSYECYGDIFYGNPQLSAFNQRLELFGRIGRDKAIWRPFVSASDLTGSNLLMAELVNRTRRIRVLPGLIGEYKFSDRTGWNQTFSYYIFKHPDPIYINYNVMRTEQEITYRVLNDVRVLAWTEYRNTIPDAGSSGNEFFVGAGWYGKPDPRIYTELRIGWDFLSLSDSVPDRQNMSGVRFNGYTTFDWGPRFRFTFRYDRDYVFNEIDENDNYVSTLLQLRGEFFLGGNWYITPYLGFSVQEYETSQRLTLQWRPEIEISYALPHAFEANQQRIFAKIGYTTSDTIQGEGDPVSDWRFSLGFNWKY